MESLIEPPFPTNDQKSVLLKVAIPYTAPKETSTRTVATTKENTIKTLDILAFKVDGEEETFLYAIDAQKSAAHTEGTSMQEFNVKLFVKDFPQRFVLVTNARSQIESLIGSRVDEGWVGVEKEEMLQHLITTNYTVIPMWGETAPKIIDPSATMISDYPIPMLRMIAKIEVKLDETVTGLTDAFKIKSVSIYNTNTSGRVVPKPGTEYVGTEMKAKRASLPASVTSVVGPIVYAHNETIYLFETAAKNGGNLLEETCIVVGGLFGSDTHETYYRLDFLSANGTTHTDVLRNHKYTCNITAVHGRGYPTRQEAFSAKPLNMASNMVTWDMGQIHYITFDDHYMLGVSHKRYELSYEAHSIADTDNILKATTDYPGGWTATVCADMAGTIPSSWLNITPYLGAGGAQPDDVHLLTAPNTGLERTAYIHFKAGRLTNIIAVTQGMPQTILFELDGVPMNTPAKITFTNGYTRTDAVNTLGQIPGHYSEYSLTVESLSLNGGTPILIGRKGVETIYLKYNNGNLEHRNVLNGAIPIGAYSELQLINTASGALSENYKQEADINLMDKPWTPIGRGNNATNRFTGRYDGNGHLITGLYINNTSLDYAGLFGYVGATGAPAEVVNLGVLGSVTGREYVGGLVGYLYMSTIENCFSAVDVTGAGATATAGHRVGGVAGQIYYGSNLVNSFATGNVKGLQNVGGVVGLVNSNSNANTTTVENCYATGAVSGAYLVGGVAGQINTGGIVRNSVALNPYVQSAPSTTTQYPVGRVLVKIVASNNSVNNYAWTGMGTNNGEPFLLGTQPTKQDVHNGYDGVSIHSATIGSAAFWTTTSTSSTTPWTGWDTSIWTITNGKLPGLFNKTVDLPAHL